MMYKHRNSFVIVHNITSAKIVVKSMTKTFVGTTGYKVETYAVVTLT